MGDSTMHLHYKAGCEEVPKRSLHKETVFPKLLSKVKKHKTTAMTCEDTAHLLDKKSSGKKRNKEEKPKRRGWKRVRHAALVTCRYIGLGIATMYPIYPLPTGIEQVPHYHPGYFNSNDPEWLAGLAFTRW